MDINTKLSELGIRLPEAPAPAANYIPFVETNGLIFVSGQVSQDYSGLILGVLGQNMSIEEGYKAAKSCAVSLLSQLSLATGGDLNRVKKIIKLGGFVNCDPMFKDQPKIINGASDFFVELFGEKGRHARTAVGCVLPLGVAVEIDGVFEIS
jgi:enamine deaminase RidA (YjgF/YER057c/UK114 family)